MYGFYNWLDKIRRYHRYSKDELKNLGIAILLMSITLGYNDGQDVFSLAHWVGNFILGAIAISIAVFARESIKRVVALEQGYRLEFQPVMYGLLGGIVLSVMSYGTVVVLMYSGFRMHLMEAHRLGYFRYGFGYFTQGKIAFFGILTNVVLALFFSTLGFLPHSIYTKLVLVNILFAVTNVLPIPWLDGGRLLFSSRIVYGIVLGFVLAICTVLTIDLYFVNVPWFVIVLVAILGAIMSWLAFLEMVQGTFKQNAAGGGGH